MSYTLAKFVHVSAVAITFALFILRGLWMLRDAPQLRQRWVRVIPHVNDTMLLVAALHLASFYGPQPWILAKVAGLLLYIGLGTVALHRGRQKSTRAAAFLAAECVFAYIVAVALTHDPFVVRPTR